MRERGALAEGRRGERRDGPGIVTPAFPRGLTPARAVLPAAMGLFVGLCTPVVVRGAPLADDFSNCLTTARLGVGGALAASAERLGAVRPARFLELLLAAGVCPHLPFGAAIAVPLGLTLAVALLLRRLLADLGAPEPWPQVGGALWLLQPLGTEAALWPAALHVPLGMALALGAVLLHRRARHAPAALFALGACLSAEQVILALPVAVWLVTPAARRSRAMAWAAPVPVAVVAAYVLFPGNDPRLAVTLGERVAGLLADPAYYVQYPAVGLGLHSIPLAVLWLAPASLLLLGLAGAAGWWLGAALAGDGTRSGLGQTLRAGVPPVALLVVLVNLPVWLSVPRQGSPRVFTPTWLVLAAALALALGRLRLPGWRWVGAALGVFAAGAALSLALSVSVRLHSADFTQAATDRLASRSSDGQVIAVCGVRRTVVEPAPYGAFAVHELVYEWAARNALDYYTGRRARFRLAGELWDRPCPEDAGVTASFRALLRATGARR